MKILVTGGLGMIGVNLVKRLLGDGHSVRIVDNLWRGSVANLCSVGLTEDHPLIELKIGDLTDLSVALSAVEDIDCVFHLADIVAGINFVFGNELFIWQKNLRINSNIIQASVEKKVKQFLYVGTACSYPKGLQSSRSSMGLHEDDAYPADPESAYGWSKLMGEYETLLAHREFGVESIVLRLHNVYGIPSELSEGRSQVIPSLCRKAANYPSERFLVWGSGHQRRAFIHVADVVEGLSLAMQASVAGEVIQLGPEESISIGEIASKVVEISNKPIDIEFDLTRPEGDFDRYADSTKAKDLLGWSPTVSIDDGLRDLYGWVSKCVTDK